MQRLVPGYDRIVEERKHAYEAIKQRENSELREFARTIKRVKSVADGLENNLDTLADVLNANVEYRDKIPEKKVNRYDHYMNVFS